jgi:hypothetical protein
VRLLSVVLENYIYVYTFQHKTIKCKSYQLTFTTFQLELLLLFVLTNFVPQFGSGLKFDAKECNQIKFKTVQKMIFQNYAFF